MKIDFTKQILTHDDGTEVAFKDLHGYTIYEGIGILNPEKTDFLYAEKSGEVAKKITLGTVKPDNSIELEATEKTFEVNGEKYFFEKGKLMKEPNELGFANLTIEKTDQEFSGITKDGSVSFYKQVVKDNKENRYVSKVGISTKKTAPLLEVKPLQGSVGFSVVETNNNKYVIIKAPKGLESLFEEKFKDSIDKDGNYHIPVKECRVLNSNQVEIHINGAEDTKILANAGNIEVSIGGKKHTTKTGPDNAFNITFSKDAISQMLTAKDNAFNLYDTKGKKAYSSKPVAVKLNSLSIEQIQLIASIGKKKSTGANAYKETKIGDITFLTCTIDKKPVMFAKQGKQTYIFHDKKFTTINGNTLLRQATKKDTPALYYTTKATGTQSIELPFATGQDELLSTIYNFEEDVEELTKEKFDREKALKPNLNTQQLISEYGYESNTTLVETTPSAQVINGTTIDDVILDTPATPTQEQDPTTGGPEPDQKNVEEIQPDKENEDENTDGNENTTETTETTENEDKKNKEKEDKKKRSAFWDTMGSGFAYTSFAAFIGAALLGMPIFAFIGVLLLAGTFMCKGFSAAGGFGSDTYDTTGAGSGSDHEPTNEKDLIKAYEKGLGLSNIQRLNNQRYRYRVQENKELSKKLSELVVRLYDPSTSEKARKKLEKEIAYIKNTIKENEKANLKLIKGAPVNQLLGLMGPKPNTIDATTVRDYEDQVFEQISIRCFTDLINVNKEDDVNYTKIPKEVRDALGNMTPAERALLLENIDEISMKIYKGTFPAELKQREAEIHQNKKDFLEDNKDFDFENPAIALNNDKFTAIKDKDGNITGYSYELSNSDGENTTKYTITPKEMEAIKKAKEIKDSEEALSNSKQILNTKAREYKKKNVAKIIEVTNDHGISEYFALDKDGKQIGDKLSIFEQAAVKTAIERGKALEPILQKRKALDNLCLAYDNENYTEIQSNKAKSIKHLNNMLKPQQHAKTDEYLSGKKKEEVLEYSDVEAVRAKLKEDGFTDEQINKITYSSINSKPTDRRDQILQTRIRSYLGLPETAELSPKQKVQVTKIVEAKIHCNNVESLRHELQGLELTPEQIEKIIPMGVTKSKIDIEADLKKEDETYKKNIERKNAIIENNPELQDKLAKLMEGKSADKQVEISKVMDEMIRNEKLNSLEKLIAFCDHYSEDTTSPFYEWRTALETSETISNPSPLKEELRQQEEDPSKYDYGKVEAEFIDDLINKKDKKKKKKKSAVKDTKNL